MLKVKYQSFALRRYFVIQFREKKKSSTNFTIHIKITEKELATTEKKFCLKQVFTLSGINLWFSIRRTMTPFRFKQGLRRREVLILQDLLYIKKAFTIFYIRDRGLK